MSLALLPTLIYGPTEGLFVGHLHLPAQYKGFWEIDRVYYELVSPPSFWAPSKFSWQHCVPYQYLPVVRQLMQVVVITAGQGRLFSGVNGSLTLSAGMPGDAHLPHHNTCGKAPQTLCPQADVSDFFSFLFLGPHLQHMEVPWFG